MGETGQTSLRTRCSGACSSPGAVLLGGMRLKAQSATNGYKQKVRKVRMERRHSVEYSG